MPGIKLGSLDLQPGTLTTRPQRQSDRNNNVQKCNNCINIPSYYISLLEASHRILSNVLLSRVSAYVDQITEDHQHGFQCNKSTTEQMSCICLIVEEKWGYNVTVYQLFIDSDKDYDSVQKEILYNILEFWGIHETSQAY
jgi:hypothetical protein